MKKIGIIGGSGFIGTRLAQRLYEANLNFKIYDLKEPYSKYTYEYLNVSESSSLNIISECDEIINLSAEHKDDIRPKRRYDDVNVLGAINICESCRKYGIKKIIFTSSVAVYGFAPENTDESGEPNYFNDYGRTKYLAEKVYRKWQAEDPKNRCLVIVRPTVIFGEGNRGNVYNLLKQINSRKFIMFGNGKNKKSMAYVDNVAAFLEYCLSFKPGLHTYNYIDKPDFDMNTLVSEARKTLFGKNNVGFRLPAFLGVGIGYLADLFTKITGKSLSVSGVRVRKFMSTTQFISSVSESDFIPPVNLKEALESTLRYEFIEDNSDKQTFETE